ncbi:hypothetical protein ABBQ32_011022 [Trebouxia sp. C0010 RCD-2024]
MVVAEVRREGLTGPTRSSALVLKPKLKSRHWLEAQQWLPVVTPSYPQVRHPHTQLEQPYLLMMPGRQRLMQTKPRSGRESVGKLADLSAPQGGPGVVPQVTEEDELQERLEGVNGAMPRRAHTPVMDRPAEIPHDSSKVPQLEDSRPPSLPPSSPTQRILDHNPQATPHPAALFQQEAVPLRAQPREKSSQGVAGGTVGLQRGPASHADGWLDVAAAGGGHASFGSGGSGDHSANDDASNGCSSGGSGSISSGSGRSGGGYGGSSGNGGGAECSSGEGGSSGVSHAGSGAAVQSALVVPADAGNASGGGAKQQGGTAGDGSGGGAGMVGDSNGGGGVLGASQTEVNMPDYRTCELSEDTYANHLANQKAKEVEQAAMRPVQCVKSAVKGLGVEATMVKAGRRAGTAGQHVPCSTNCNAKQEAEAFLAELGFVAQGMVNPDCDDSAPDADMGEEEWDYAYPGCEMDEDWNGAMAPRVAPPDAATIAAPSAAPTGKALRFLTLSLIVSGVARHVINQECVDPLPDADTEEDEYDDSVPGADMEEGEWDDSNPGSEMEEDWDGVMAPETNGAAPAGPIQTHPLSGGVDMSAAPTAVPLSSDGSLQLPARPFTRGSPPAYLRVPSHTPPPLYAPPPVHASPVQPPRPFSRGWGDTPPMASAAPPSMAGPMFLPALAHQHETLGMPSIPTHPPPPSASHAPHGHTLRVLPFSRPRRDPPPPLLPAVPHSLVAHLCSQGLVSSPTGSAGGRGPLRHPSAGGS